MASDNPLDPNLAEELEVVAMDAAAGGPPGPALDRRLERDVAEYLRKRGLAVQKVTATSGRGGTFVQIWLQRPGKRVEMVKLQVL